MARDPAHDRDAVDAVDHLLEDHGEPEGTPRPLSAMVLEFRDGASGGECGFYAFLDWLATQPGVAADLPGTLEEVWHSREMWYFCDDVKPED